MAKQVKQYIKNPKYGQPGEPERILVPQMISENGAFLNRMAQIEKLEYNATQVTGNNYNGLAEALASVTNDKYKVKGIVLTWFDSAENQWKSMRYNGADSTGWSEIGNWVEIGGAGGSGNTNYYQIPAAVTELTSSSTSEEIQAAFGGDSGFLAAAKAIEEGAFLYVGLYQNPYYTYLIISNGLWRKAEVETDGVLSLSYDIPAKGNIAMEISKTGSNYKISITESSSSGGGGEGGETETYFIPSAVMSMTSETPSDEVLAAFGGMTGFEKLVEAAKAKSVGVSYEFTHEEFPTPIKYRVPAISSFIMDAEMEGVKYTGLVFTYSLFSIVDEQVYPYSIMISRTGDKLVAGGVLEQKPQTTNLPNLDVNDYGLKGFDVRSGRIDVVDLPTQLRIEGFKKIYVQRTEPYNPGESDIWIQTT